MRILVVCSGNICRSPLAAELLRARAAAAGLDDLVVDSAGTLDIEGAGADPETVETAREIGLDLTAHRSKGLREEDVRTADLVLVMERRHVQELERRYPGLSRVFLLRAFEAGPRPSTDARDVDDPVGETPEFHRTCLTTIERSIDNVLAFLHARRQAT
jgi:protein-tyrosine phosphatase